MNAKVVCCCLFMALAWLSFGNDSKPVATECGSVLGTKYISVVTIKMLTQQPKWNPLVGSIPLTVENASRKALEFANKKWNFSNVQDQLGQWDIKTVSIGRVEKMDWIYVFELLQRGPIQGIRRPMKIMVLLNGTVVEPSEAGRVID